MRVPSPDTEISDSYVVGCRAYQSDLRAYVNRKLKREIECIFESYLSCYSDISLLKPALPTDVSITYYRTDFLEETVTKCKCKYTRTDARTLSKTVENFYDYYELYFH